MKRKLCLVLVLLMAGFMAFASGAKPQAAGAGEISVASWQWFDPGIEPFWDEFQPAFEKEYPEIKMSRVDVPTGRYWDQIIVMVTAGPAPDILHATALKVKQFMAMKVLDALDDHMDLSEIRKLSYEAQTTFPVEDGKIYAYITGARTLQMIYNKKLFAAAGLSEAPKNPGELLAMARKLTKPGENQVGIGLKANAQQYEDTYDCLLGFPAGFDSDFVKDGKITATAPGTIKGVELYKQLLLEKLTAGIMIKDDVNREMLFKGKMAMYIDGPWIFSLAAIDFPDIYPDLACAHTPFENKAAIGGANHFLMIPKDAKNKAAAAKFIEFWNRKEWQERHSEITGLVVARPDAVSKKKLAKDAWFKEFVEGMNYAVAPIPAGFEKQASKFQSAVVEAAMDEVVAKNRPVPEVMKELAATLEKLR